MATGYFDTSGLAKMYHAEPGSKRVADLVIACQLRIVISRLAVTEMHSVFAMKVRSGALKLQAAEVARAKFIADIQNGLVQVLALTPAHFRGAERLLMQYGSQCRIRTLDALQLAVATALPSASFDLFVTADRALAEIAEAEGFTVSDVAHD